MIDDAPDIALLMHAANDVGTLWQDHSYRSRQGAPLDAGVLAQWILQGASSRSSLAGLTRSVVTGHATRAGDFATRRELQREQDSVDGAPFAARLRAFVRSARAFGVEPVLLTQPAISERTELTPDWIDVRNQARFNEIIRETAAAEAATLIDLARHVVGLEGWDRPMEIFYDGIHVTKRGSRVYAEYVVARLLESGLLADDDEEAALWTAPQRPAQLHQEASEVSDQRAGS